MESMESPTPPAGFLERSRSTLLLGNQEESTEGVEVVVEDEEMLEEGEEEEPWDDDKMQYAQHDDACIDIESDEESAMSPQKIVPPKHLQEMDPSQFSPSAFLTESQLPEQAVESPVAETVPEPAATAKVVETESGDGGKREEKTEELKELDSGDEQGKNITKGTFKVGFFWHSFIKCFFQLSPAKLPKEDVQGMCVYMCDPTPVILLDYIRDECGVSMEYISIL